MKIKKDNLAEAKPEFPYDIECQYCGSILTIESKEDIKSNIPVILVDSVSIANKSITNGKGFICPACNNANILG